MDNFPLGKDMKIESKEQLIHLMQSIEQRIELLIEEDLNECPDMEDYQFLKEELNKLIALEQTLVFPYWIRLHSTAEHLISQFNSHK